MVTAKFLIFLVEVV